MEAVANISSNCDLVLYLLTDEKETRPLKTRADLERELLVLAADISQLGLVLAIFVKSGLVFELPETPTERYQLVHDYLTTFIRRQQEPKLNRLKAELEQERQQRKKAEVLSGLSQEELLQAKRKARQLERIAIARTLAICFLIASFTLWYSRDRIKPVFLSVFRERLAEINLAKSYLPGVDLSDGNLSKAKLRQANLTKANLSKANLRGADFWKTYMPRANLSQANLSQANLSQADLTEGDLSKANLNKAHFVKTYMPLADLQDTDLSQADLSQANLSGGNLSRANLKGAHLQDTDFSQADLSQADLTEADLSRANLKGARLVKTFMLKTNLQDADLSGADLQGAQHLNPDQVKRAKNWEQAKYDKDFRKQLGLTGSREAK